jgi:hypothetical protein
MRAAVFWLLLIMLVLWTLVIWSAMVQDSHQLTVWKTVLERGNRESRIIFDLIVWSILAVPLACLVLIAKPR